MIEAGQHLFGSVAAGQPIACTSFALCLGKYVARRRMSNRPGGRRAGDDQVAGA